MGQSCGDLNPPAAEMDGGSALGFGRMAPLCGDQAAGRGGIQRFAHSVLRVVHRRALLPSGGVVCVLRRGGRGHADPLPTVRSPP